MSSLPNKSPANPWEPDNATGYTRPKAWFKAKEAFGPSALRTSMLRVEKRAGTGCPRLLLHWIIEAHLSLPKSQRHRLIARALERIDENDKRHKAMERLSDEENANIARLEGGAA